MKKNKKNLLPLKKGALALLAGITLSASLLTGCSGNTGPQGPAGTNGADGSMWYTGTQYSDSQGKNGDLFYDTDDKIIYQKQDGQWKIISNLDTRAYITNLFNYKSEDNENGFLNGPTGTLTQAQGQYLTSHLIPVEHQKDYTLKTLYGTAFGKESYAYLWTYDKDGNCIERVSLSANADTNNTETINDDLLHFYNDNANAKYVRFSYTGTYASQIMFVNGSEYPAKYIAYNQKFYVGNTLTDVEKEMLLSQNPLFEKSIAFEGDSICYGSTVVGSYAQFIAENNNMTMVNNSRGGGTITSGIMHGEQLTNRHSIVDGVEALVADKDKYDYIIFQGGVNDKSLDVSKKEEGFDNSERKYVEFGSITEGYTATLDKTTFCGAFETACKALARSGKKVGYIFVHKIFNDDLWNKTYKPTMIEILEKWGIPYLDLETQVPPLNMDAELRNLYTIPSTSDPSRGDGWHPNELGYKTFYVDKITAWLKTL